MLEILFAKLFKSALEIFNKRVRLARQWPPLAK